MENNSNWCEKFYNNQECTPWCDKYHNYTYCKDFQNYKTCSRGVQCIYMHLNRTEIKAYETSRTRRILVIVAAEVARTFQIGGICGGFRATGHCSNSKCTYKHFSPKIKSSKYFPKCTVCQLTVGVFDGGFLRCGHLLCNTCHLNIVENIPDRQHLESVSLQCPLCRKSVCMRYPKKFYPEDN